MLGCWVGNVDIATASSSGVVGLVVLAWAKSGLWDRNIVLALSGLQSGRTNVCCSSTTSAESAVSMVPDNTFTDNFTITIAIYMSVSVHMIREIKRKKAYGVVSSAMLPAPVKIYVSIQQK